MLSAVTLNLLLTLSLGLSHASEIPNVIEPLSFSAWKQSQILEAQNELLRTSNSLDKTSQDKEVKRAQERLDAAQNLQIEEYISVYLPGLAESPAQIEKLAEKLSKEELGAILKGLLSKPTSGSNNTSRQSVGSGLALTKIPSK